MKGSKKPYPRFLITFLLFEVLTYITFLFPLRLVLKIENPSQHKNRTFFTKSQAWFFSPVISSNDTAFKGITPKIFLS